MENDERLGVFNEITKFVEEHERSCGPVEKIAYPPTQAGYVLIALCTCGEAFDRLVTPRDATYDLVFTLLRVFPN